MKNKSTFRIKKIEQDFVKFSVLIVLGILLIGSKAVEDIPEIPLQTAELTDTSTADFDGPHIFYRAGKILVKQVFRKDSITYGKIDTLLNSIKGMPITCHINDSLFFSTAVKEGIPIEESEYKMPSKLIAISDIEGNFMAFRDFLINNGVINSDNEWIFGDGHLVLLGDFFDRGLNVTECLWFIYYLEDEAIKNGGHVHFILGNHEIMNMNEDFFYVRNKYIENTFLIKESYQNWYKPNTELGRWLQSKNIIEKIGNYLFTHGGISEDINNLKPEIDKINSSARKYYFKSNKAELSKKELMSSIFSTKVGLFWYRAYIRGGIGEDVIDRTLEHFDVSKIVVGHTIVEDVSYFFNKKVIGIDTFHFKGDTEGLLIENGIEFRVEKNGNRSVIK